MLKIRLEGKEEEINRYISIIKGNYDEYEVCCISRIIRNTTSMSIYSRCYIEIEFNDQEKKAGGSDD